MGQVGSRDLDVGHGDFAALGELDAEGSVLQDVGKHGGAFVLDLEDIAMDRVLRQGLLVGMALVLGHGFKGFEPGQGVGVEFARVGEIQTIYTPSQGFEVVRFAVIRCCVTRQRT